MDIIAVAAGGVVGAILRYMVSAWFAVSLHETEGSLFPYGTLFVNLVGCLLLGWFLTAASSKWTISEHVRLGIGTGLIGSFTTFSTFSVETLQLIELGHLALAVVYVVASVVGGVLLAALGWLTARRLPGPEEERS